MEKVICNKNYSFNGKYMTAMGLESNHRCNAKCMFCCMGYNNGKQKVTNIFTGESWIKEHKLMSWNLIENIFKRHKSEMFILTGQNEPFLDNRINDILDYSDKIGINNFKLSIFSNANAMTEEVLDKLIPNKKFISINFSLNAFSDETRMDLMNLSYKNAEEKIMMFLEKRRKYGREVIFNTNNPLNEEKQDLRVGISFIMAHGIREDGKFVSNIKELQPFKQHWNKILNNYHCNSQVGIFPSGNWANGVPRKALYQQFEKENPNGCGQFECGSPTVDVDGQIMLCCYNSSISFGSILDDEAMERWLNRKEILNIGNIKDGKLNYYPLTCKDCSFRYIPLSPTHYGIEGENEQAFKIMNKQQNPCKNASKELLQNIILSKSISKNNSINNTTVIGNLVNKFGDGIDWENHVNEIVDTKKIDEIFYTKENEKINHLKKYKSTGKILDCGCHIGRWIEVFRENNYDYTGVDQSILALETARKYKPYGKFVHNLLWNMSFNNEFDIVHTNAVLQHNKLEEQEKILPRMHQALKSNGILVITESTVNKETETQRTYQGWITFIEKHGFKFMESWHKNDLGFEDNYLFIKSEVKQEINNESKQDLSGTKFPITIEKTKTDKWVKFVTKEDLIQLLKHKTPKQENACHVTQVSQVSQVFDNSLKEDNSVSFKDRWNIFLTLQGNDVNTPATSESIITPIEDMRNRLTHYGVYDYFNSFIFHSNKVLVIGAGDGGEVKLLKEKGFDVTGTTLHWSDKKFAKNFYDVELSIEDMHNMSFNNESFDGIYSFHSLEHAISPLIALFEIRRVLKKNGKLYAIVPQSGTGNETGIQHYSVLTETLWKHLLDIIGFKDIQVYSESGNTIMKAVKDMTNRDFPGKQFETELKKLQTKIPQKTITPLYNLSVNESSHNHSELASSDRCFNMDKWWNSYLAIPNKVEFNGHGADYSNLNDTSSSGLVYYIEEFCNNVPLSQYPRILDIGAGNGGETRILLDKGYTVTGVTMGDDNVKIAKELYNVNILNMDMNHLDFIINSFDAILTIQTFEHFLSPFIATIELWRVLKVGGLCYIDVPCPLDKPMWSINHTNLLYADQIINMFSMCGFELVKQLSKNKEHRIRLIFKKLSISKIRNWEQLRYVHQLRNEACIHQ